MARTVKTGKRGSETAKPAEAASIGLVLVTHGALGDALRATLEHIVGPMDGVAVVPIGPEDDVVRRRTEILAAIADVNTGAGCIVMTDMFGGTPSNLALSALGAANQPTNNAPKGE